MLEGLQGAIGGLTEDVTQFVSEKPLQTAVIGAGLVGATALGVAVVKRKKRKKKTKKGRARDRKFRSKQKHELAYVRKKRKDNRSVPMYR